MFLPWFKRIGHTSLVSVSWDHSAKCLRGGAILLGSLRAGLKRAELKRRGDPTETQEWTLVTPVKVKVLILQP